MYLALDKNGKLGRMVKNQRALGANNMDVGRAVVATPVAVQPFKNHVLSQHRIELDAKEQYQRKVQARRQRDSDNYQRQQAKRAQKFAIQAGNQEAAFMQGLKPKDRNNEILKRYFTKQANMSETAKVNRSLGAVGPKGYGTLPMDFDQLDPTQDYASEIGSTQDQLTKGNYSRADFRYHEMIGSPLTNNGQFGPSTDYDLFIAKHELDNSMPIGAPEVLHPGDLGDTGMIVGGTMLGRYNGKVIPLRRSMLTGRSRHLPRFNGFGDNGDDSTDSSVDLSDDSYANLAEAPVDTTVATAAPQVATPVATSAEAPSFWSQLGNQLTGGLATGVSTAATQKLVGVTAGSSSANLQQASNLSSSNPVTKLAAQLSIPAWTIYAGVGLVLVGGLIVLSRR